MTRRVLTAAVLICALTFSGNAQPTLPPILPTNALILPTAVPTLTPSLTPSFTLVPTDPPTSLPTETRTPISDTPEPTETIDPISTNEPLDIEVVADVLFPAGIAFSVTFYPPETGISSITMTAEQDGWEGQVIDVDPGEVQTNEIGYSVITMLWEITDDPPQLFEPITVTWTVTPRGRAGESSEIDTAFADSRVMWMIADAGEVPVRIAAAASRTTGAVLAAQIALLDELLEAVGREIEPIKVVLLPVGLGIDPCVSSPVLIGQQTAVLATCEVELVASLYESQDWDIANLSFASPVGNVITEKIVRAVYPDLFASEDVPEWLKTGMIAYFAGAFNINDLELARGASRTGSLLLSLDVVPSNETEAAQWRLQSIGMVVYMASQIGVVPILELFDRIDSGERLADVWPELSGQNLEILRTSWRNWIFSLRAENAFAQPPRLDPTPTFVPTRTVTPTRTMTSTLTPSATLTSTQIPTATLTLTPSLVSGFVQPTAPPTTRPSETPLPTLTPRPAESFSLGEIPDETVPAPDNSVLIAVAVPVVIGFGLVLGLIWMRRRR